ncbi:hypothetical protein VIGAN_04093200 [Vigna angularis var. angularis]|uniref:Uncharacterized protein n=1 Tax=Vigna angularis var. angularis TaxID=157739 RepID=A0A0S3RT06_PHAAN|nr:hypothetical protein VIGAN_04093200 [Vigna angularis var. angularis]
MKFNITSFSKNRNLHLCIVWENGKSEIALEEKNETPSRPPSRLPNTLHSLLELPLCAVHGFSLLFLAIRAVFHFPFTNTLHLNCKIII